jgi:hypothetical protein
MKTADQPTGREFMKATQVSVFLENKKGRLLEVTSLLSKQNINIRALSLADTADFGVLRLIVNDSPAALKILKENNFVAQKTDVIALEVPDSPGGLNAILAIFSREDINVEYMYAFVEKKADNAVVVFKINDYDRGIELLQKSGVAIIPGEHLESL